MRNPIYGRLSIKTTEEEEDPPLSDQTIIGGIPWYELKHKLKDVSFDKN